MKLGLFGGTFDPPHYGHLIVAQDAIEALGLDRILFIPAGIPPHKQHQRVTPREHRLRMLELAVGEDPRFGIETLELERDGASYTVDTAGALAARYPDAELFLLIGADQYRELATWREPERLAGLVTIAVMSRDGVEAGPSAVALEDMGDLVGGGPGGMAVDRVDGAAAVFVSVTRIDISSSLVRARRAAGRGVRYLVPPAVEAYLEENELYPA